MTEERRGPGRPRQPFCPDCIKAGRPKVPKAPGAGYCTDCQYRRQRSYRRADVEGISREDAYLKELRDEIDDARAEAVKQAQNATNMAALVERLRQDADATLFKEWNSARILVRTYQTRLHELFPEEYAHPDDPDQTPPAFRIGSPT